MAVAIEAALANYVLYFATFELYLLSRALILPISMLWMKTIMLKGGSSNISIQMAYPLLALSFCICMVASQKNMPHRVGMVWAAIASSFPAALWPFQVEYASRAFKSEADQDYIPIDALPDQNVNVSSSNLCMELKAVWQLLYFTSLLSAVFLGLFVIGSDEIGHIMRNCYLLQEPAFRYQLLARVIARLILFVSSILLIKATSALSFNITFVVAIAFQIVNFSIAKLHGLQIAGLVGCVFAGGWYLWTYHAADRTSPYNESHPLGKTLELKVSLEVPLRGWLFAVVISTGLVGTLLFFTMPFAGTNTEPDGYKDDLRLFTPVWANDAYLGPRPDTDMMANIALMVERCRGTYEELEHVRNIFDCLEFLSTRQDDYLVNLNAPVVREGTLSGRDRTIPGYEIRRQESSASECTGPVIPYHIWWSGPPSWRTELFIKSYLHTQNMACSRLWIWINSEHHPGALDMWRRDVGFQCFQSLIERGDIVLKEWKLPDRVLLSHELDELDKARFYAKSGRPNSKGETLVADLIVRDASGNEWLLMSEYNDQITYFTVAVSDAARLIILHLYGGVYLDMDMILLRDLRPLLLSPTPFAERWGAWPRMYNNALLSLPANSSISSYLLYGGARMGMTFHFVNLGRMLLQEQRDEVSPRGLTKLESAFFDPIWTETDGAREGRCTLPCLKRFEDVFEAAPVLNEWESYDGGPLPTAAPGQNRSMENFFRGAFAYHVHNRWNAQVEVGSWIDVICRTHDGYLNGSRTNPYGEKWTGPAIAAYGT
ncbi:MAG: hypothetical protein M1818_006007 [Claussenomyces sp. TS43310]|nr:MAG: hypothetical protein M1818_006007 [Claussenomyces sp. TS43310]